MPAGLYGASPQWAKINDHTPTKPLQSSGNLEAPTPTIDRFDNDMIMILDLAKLRDMVDI
jgi:hypothetical protein